MQSNLQTGISNPISAPGITYSRESVRADSARKAAWQRFRNKNGDKWRVRWNTHTGLPASIFMGLTKKKYAGNAQQAAHTFLAEHRELFGVGDLKQLKYVKTQTYRGVRHVTFQQTVKGVPVYEAEYKVHLRGNGQVDMANGTFYPNIEVSTSPAISKSGAVTSARSDLELPAGTNLKTTSKLVIYRQQDQFHLAWKLTLFSKQPFADWFYMIDAQSGEILYKLNQLTDVTGDGDVYPTHPGLSSVTNKPLYRLNGNGSLDGVYANIVNDESSEAYSASNSFQYSPSNTHFDEVNLYYHVDDYRQNFIDGIDDGRLNFTKITAHAHASDPNFGDTNAWFSPSSGDLYFGDASSSSFYNDFAKEDKVIQHEYGHAVIYDVQSGIQSESSEEGAISEGTPDYWAGSYTGRSVIGDYIGSTRDMDNPDVTSYSQYESEEPVEAHRGGEFFSSILWDLRNSVGGNTTDFLVYDALYRVTGDPDFLDFSDAMIAADYEAYQGSDADEIQNTFAARGVGSFTPLDVSISGPSSLDTLETGTWTANVNDGTSPYSYTWYSRSDYPGTSWSEVGSGPSYSGASLFSFDLKVEVTDANNRSGYDIQGVSVVEIPQPCPSCPL